MNNTAHREECPAQFHLHVEKGITDVQQALVETRAHHLMAIGNIAAGLVHDVRNLLAAVDSGVRLAEQNLGEPTVARTYLHAAREGIARAAKATSDVLNFATHAPAAISVENANDLIYRAMPLLKCAAGSEICLKSTLTPNDPLCLTEVCGFQNALLNLVVNARDAMPSGGQVQIRTDHVEGCCDIAERDATSFVRVTVEDQGHGMSSEIMQRMLAPFFSTKGKGGSGLGLPQVCAFVQSVNGHLQISSNPDLGTSVRLLFVARNAAKLTQ